MKIKELVYSREWTLWICPHAFMHVLNVENFLKIQTNSWKVCHKPSCNNRDKNHGHFVFCFPSSSIVRFILNLIWICWWCNWCGFRVSNFCCNQLLLFCTIIFHCHDRCTFLCVPFYSNCVAERYAVCGIGLGQHVNMYSKFLCVIPTYVICRKCIRI